MLIRLALLSAAALAVASCTHPDPAAPQDETDPAVAQAVIAPLLTDPDLVSLDKRFAVMSDPGPLEASLPPDGFAPATIAAARVQAAALMRGIATVPLAKSGACAGCAGVLLAERARVLGPACAVNLDESLDWASRLPDDLPVYPKAHLREAVGGEDGACRLRGASFTAPVPAGQVLAFYRAMAARAGYTLRGAGKDGLVGTRGSSRLAIIARPQPGDMAHFDLLVAG